MCTAIAKKGKDVIYGFNFDVDPKIWGFDLYKTSKHFAVGITVGKTLYLVHGVNRDGHFAVIPYMNGEMIAPPKGIRRERIDLMADRYVRGKYSFEDVDEILDTKAVTNIKAATLHALIGNEKGDFRIVEPGYGIEKVAENYAVLANFPVLTVLDDYYANPFYGKDRYDRVLAALKASGDDFSIQDALALLEDAKVEGRWGTRVSFVYSRNENTVYYALDGDFSNIQTHKLG